MWVWVVADCGLSAALGSFLPSQTPSLLRPGTSHHRRRQDATSLFLASPGDHGERGNADRPFYFSAPPHLFCRCTVPRHSRHTRHTHMRPCDPANLDVCDQVSSFVFSALDESTMTHMTHLGTARQQRGMHRHPFSAFATSRAALHLHQV